MTAFVDTSALYALLDRNDQNHQASADAFAEIVRQESLVTHNYVMLESTALVQRRLGVEAVRALMDDVLPAVELAWVDESVHRAAVAALLASTSRDVSLVDWTSFEVMRRLAVERAFAFDDDFAAQGFSVLPA